MSGLQVKWDKAPLDRISQTLRQKGWFIFWYFSYDAVARQLRGVRRRFRVVAILVLDSGFSTLGRKINRTIVEIESCMWQALTQLDLATILHPLLSSPIRACVCTLVSQALTNQFTPNSAWLFFETKKTFWKTFLGSSPNEDVGFRVIRRIMMIFCDIHRCMSNYKAYDKSSWKSYCFTANYHIIRLLWKYNFNSFVPSFSIQFIFSQHILLRYILILSCSLHSYHYPNNATWRIKSGLNFL